MKLRKNHKNWDDMSDFVVHLVKPAPLCTSEAPEWKVIDQILSDQCLKPKNRFGIAAKCAYAPNQHAVCFSEIPLGQLARLVEKRSTCGIGFRKQYIVDRGGGPIMYAYEGTPHEQAIRKMMAANRLKPNADIWKLTPMIDSAGAQRFGGQPYLFEWEREWRFVGEFKFDPKDVAFVIIPEEHHDGVRCVLDGPTWDSPEYYCPLIDATWSRDESHKAFARYEEQLTDANARRRLFPREWSRGSEA